jgi:putative phosphonate metabolism protein
MRFAIYYTAPADDPLTRLASAWLGRDAFSGAAIDARDGPDALTAAPRRYGFHGTLKAPFHLAPGADQADLITAFHAFAARQAAFELAGLNVGQLGAFFALVPDGTEPQLHALADDCVRSFEPFRRALTPQDIARREPHLLTARQRDHLQQWGYPFVFDDFRFHMTLTGPVPAEQAPGVAATLKKHFASVIDQPRQIATIGLSVEPEPGADFRIIELAQLGAPDSRGNA